MPHIITEPCVGTCDTACVAVCPVDCIHPTKEEWDESYKEDIKGKQLYIDNDTCTDCTLCVPECPVEAIFEEEDLPEGQEKYIEINSKYFENT